MSPATIGIGALVLAVLVGFTLTIGAPWPALPIVFAAIAFGVFVWYRGRQNEARQMREHRAQADESEVDFTARDRETLAS